MLHNLFQVIRKPFPSTKRRKQSSWKTNERIVLYKKKVDCECFPELYERRLTWVTIYTTILLLSFTNLPLHNTCFFHNKSLYRNLSQIIKYLNQIISENKLIICVFVHLHYINFKRKIWTWTGIRTRTSRSLDRKSVV